MVKVFDPTLDSGHHRLCDLAGDTRTAPRSVNSATRVAKAELVWLTEREQRQRELVEGALGVEARLRQQYEHAVEVLDERVVPVAQRGSFSMKMKNGSTHNLVSASKIGSNQSSPLRCLMPKCSLNSTNAGT